MKRFFIILSIGVMGFTYLALDNSLALLGIKRDSAINYIKTSIAYGTLSFPAEAKKVAVAARTEIAVDMVALAKEYTETAAFKQWYAELRKAKEPHMPLAARSSAPNSVSTQLAQTNTQIEETRKKMAAAPENERQAYQTFIDNLQKTAVEQAEMEQRQRANNEPTPDMASNQAYMHDVKLYNDSLAIWKTIYPESPVPLIKARLQQYIDLLATVDFSAQTTTDEKGIQKFVNTDYEKKSGDWKRCYRAGKDVNDAARTSVFQWLSSLH
jgi:flagellar biosynthesis GTPase FlhF